MPAMVALHLVPGSPGRFQPTPPTAFWDPHYIDARRFARLTERRLNVPLLRAEFALRVVRFRHLCDPIMR